MTSFSKGRWDVEPTTSSLKSQATGHPFFLRTSYFFITHLLTGSKEPFVHFILLSGAPLEVTGFIIKRVAIEVVDLPLTIRIGTEMESDQPMNNHSFSYPKPGQVYISICTSAMFPKHRFQVGCSSNSAHVSQIGDLIGVFLSF